MQTSDITIGRWLSLASAKLRECGIKSYRLDAELLLATTLEKDRTYLHSHPDTKLNEKQVHQIAQWLIRRQKREPIAYIRGFKEFYGRNFIVTPDVLIPRPETEEIIEILKSSSHTSGKLLDLGTGSGAIGITAKLEIPNLNVTLSDIDTRALNIARRNTQTLRVKPLRFVQSDLLEHWLSHTQPTLFDVIVANLPYVDKEWSVSPETDYEPSLALFAPDEGLELIKRCIRQAPRLLRTGGLLILEADTRQHEQIITYARRHQFSVESQSMFIMSLRHL